MHEFPAIRRSTNWERKQHRLSKANQISHCLLDLEFRRSLLLVGHYFFYCVPAELSPLSKLCLKWNPHGGTSRCSSGDGRRLWVGPSKHCKHPPSLASTTLQNSSETTKWRQTRGNPSLLRIITLTSSSPLVESSVQLFVPRTP